MSGVNVTEQEILVALQHLPATRWGEVLEFIDALQGGLHSGSPTLQILAASGAPKSPAAAASPGRTERAWAQPRVH